MYQILHAKVFKIKYFILIFINSKLNKRCIFCVLHTVRSVCPRLKNNSPSGSLVRNLTDNEPLVVPSQFGSI